MGNSSHGILFFGVKLDSDSEPPWDAEEFAGSEDDWWMSICGFQPKCETPYDDRGEYKRGMKEGDPRIEAWYEERRAFKTANPFPFDMRMIGYHDEPSYVLAAKDQVHTAEWDECLEVTPKLLAWPDGKAQELMEFCEKYDIEVEGKVGWWLTSSYG